MNMRSAVLAVIALTAEVRAFTVLPRPTVSPTSPGLTRLSMADEDGSTMKSVKKQIVYDEKSGRFFESNKDEGECIPDEEFCVVDKESGAMIRLTVEEKERIFLDALQAYYFDNRQMLNDQEFDLLKEDLQWNGSELVQMNRKEATYLAAVQAYMKGTPTMTDGEFDTLKNELMEDGSTFAVSTEPKCYIDTGICKVTMKEDKFRTNLLYLPAGSIIALVWLGLGFEVIEPIIRLNPVILALLGTPLVVSGSKFITENFIFENNFVVYGPCPSCQAANRVYFGDILGVEGFSDVASVKCPNCKAAFTVQRNTLRASTIPKN